MIKITVKCNVCGEEIREEHFYRFKYGFDKCTIKEEGIGSSFSEELNSIHCCDKCYYELQQKIFSMYYIKGEHDEIY